MNIERGNILIAARCAVQNLLDTFSVNQQSVIDFDDDNDILSVKETTLSRLLCCIEHGLCHGVLPLSTLQPDPWPIISQVCSETVVADVDQIEEVKTGLGKTRLWIRMLLMRKQLGCVVRELIDKWDDVCAAEVISNSVHRASKAIPAPVKYAQGALLASDEGANFAGVLIGLNVIDFCFVLKNNLERFDRPLDVIDYKVYIESNFDDCLSSIAPGQSEIEERLSNVIDQNNYLEETLSSTQSRLEKSNESNRLLTLELSRLLSDVGAAEQTRKKLQNENTRLSNLLVRQSREVQDDLQTVRETFKISSSTLDNLNAELQKQLQEESMLRMEVEKALTKETDLRISIQADLKLCQQSNREKQQYLNELRSQNTDLKTLNQDFSSRLVDLTVELEKMAQSTSQLKQKADGMNDVINSMDERFTLLKEEKADCEKALHQATARAAASEQRSIRAEMDLQVSKEEVLTCNAELDKLALELGHLESLRKQISNKNELLSSQEDRLAKLLHLCEQQETALQEMGMLVKMRTLEANVARELVDGLQDAKWRGDAEAESCQQCVTPFSISRRKHHCRNCGLIFCYECSDYRMPLPSSSKPVRVCERCHNQLLERYSAR